MGAISLHQFIPNILPTIGEGNSRIGSCVF